MGPALTPDKPRIGRGYRTRPLQVKGTWEEEVEEQALIKDLKRHARLAVAWDRHGSPVPRWTLTRYGLDKTPTRLALQSRGAARRVAPDRRKPDVVTSTLVCTHFTRFRSQIKSP